MSKGQIDLTQLLLRIPLFNSLGPDDVTRIAAGVKEVKAARGEILFHRGDVCTGFHLILYGQVKLGFNSSQGNEKVVEILGPGQTFGEAVMFMESPYVVFAQALTDATLLHVSKETVFAEIERDPRFARKIIAGLSMRLHQLVQDVESYSLHSGRERVIGYLLQAIPEADAGKPGLTIALPTAKGTIASRLNLTSEHFSRILGELSNDGLIVVHGRHIEVPDIKRLQQGGG